LPRLRPLNLLGILLLKIDHSFFQRYFLSLCQSFLQAMTEG